MKRFTETAKWSDPWFLDLSVDAKLAFWYITENCDGAGIWEPNFRLANFCLKRDIDWDSVRGEFGSRLRVLEGGKWFVVKFIRFQCGTLSRDCKPHVPVFRSLEKHGIDPSEFEQESTPDEGQIPNGIERSAKGSETLQEKDKEKDKEWKEVQEETAEMRIYASYPRKTARGAALKAIRKALETVPAETLMAKVMAYNEATAQWPQGDRAFIPHPATWFNQERYADDPTTWVRQITNGHRHENHDRSHGRGFAQSGDYSQLVDKR